MSLDISGILHQSYLTRFALKLHLVVGVYACLYVDSEVTSYYVCIENLKCENAKLYLWVCVCW